LVDFRGHRKRNLLWKVLLEESCPLAKSDQQRMLTMPKIKEPLQVRKKRPLLKRGRTRREVVVQGKKTADEANSPRS